MRSTFHGIETLRRAIVTSSAAMDVAAHNVSNAGTPGYSRQVVKVRSTSQVFSGSQGSVGTGVEIISVERLRSSFLDAQIRGQTSTASYWGARGEILGQIEALLAEPGPGLSSHLDRFWESWHDLSSYPESMAARSSVYENTKALLGEFNQVWATLEAWQGEIASSVDDAVRQINSLAAEIASLSQLINARQASGDMPNDLLDARDHLLTQMSQHVGITIHQDNQGTFLVSIGGIHLVDGESVRQLTFDNSSLQPVIGWQGLDAQVNLNMGQLAGYLSAQDYITTQLQGGLMNMMEGLQSEINPAHMAGYGLDGLSGRAFFDTGASPGQWSLDQSIMDDLVAIAASQGGQQGDGLNALAIAGLKSRDVLGQFTVDDYWRNMVVALGVTSQESVRQRDNQAALIEQIHIQQESIAGVSLDEEMVRMVELQHMYSSAARMMTVMDEMLETIVRGMGIAGR